MDGWIQFGLMFSATMISNACLFGVGLWKLGGLFATVRAIDERQQREHSKLFARTDKHGEQITTLKGAVVSIDGRVGALETTLK